MYIPLEEFVRCFFDSGEIMHIRVFDDHKNGTFSGQKYQVEAGKISALVDTLNKHNAQNRGVFFTINYGGDTDESISRVNAVFVENDTLSIEEQVAQLESFSLPPSLMVKTAKSVHAYWLVKSMSVAEFRKYQRRLITQFEGDAACVNESRVLRLPGFNHCKSEPIMVEVIKFSPELKYTAAQLDEALPAIAGEPTVLTLAPKGQRRGLTQVINRCDFIEHMEMKAASLPENLWYAGITNLAVFDGGDKEIHLLSKPYPKYNYQETQGKIAHFIQSGTKPMTCAKIAELGFKCLKLEKGECSCKSPAALCYLPLTVGELVENLNNIEIPQTQLEKIQALRGLVIEYLYNIEPVTAETLLNYNARERFGLKAQDIKPLIALHRETYKRYADSKETRQANEGGELSDWYEVTERGGFRFLPGILADHMSSNVNAFYGAGSYYFYEHGVYIMREDYSAQNAVRQFMITRQEKTADVNDALSLWRMRVLKPVREINANPFILNLRNGLYNVLDGTFKEHSPQYFSTVQINANYDPTAKCPRFLRFLADILPESELPLMQEIFGYLLIPVNKAQKSFVFVGAPNAGKSTLLSIAQEVLLGSDNVSNIPWQALGDRFNKAELFGKLANIFADLPSKAIDDGGMFKALTGEDSISAERKGKDPFNFRPYARLLFSCNDIPKNYADRSDGFYRRLLIIRFNKSVPQNRRDPNLLESLASERDGILTWALEGLKSLMSNSYIFSETDKTREEIRRYKVESNSALMFIVEGCEVTADAECVREMLFDRYREYCGKNGLKALSQTNFNKEVESSDLGITRAVDKLGKRRTWRGVRLVDGV